MIVVVDYGMGNLRSVQKAFERLKIAVKISSRREDIARAEKLILPGVGHFGNGMERLKSLDIIGILNEKVLADKTPILGICLGMQLLGKYSEEGDCEGLGWIDVQTRAFDFDGAASLLKIPHMGWNTIRVCRGHKLLKDHREEKPFYFVHSYYVPYSPEYCMASTEYGVEFSSVIFKDNIFGTQFHPEKSHRQGLQLLKNFAEYRYV